MKRRLFSTCVAGVIGVLVHGAPAWAVTTLTADADTFIQKGVPDNNFGGAGDMVVKDSGSQSFTRKAYVRFDVSGIALNDLLDASFDLVVSARTPGSQSQQNYPIQIFGLPDGHAGENWSENSITWNNAPANDTADNDFLGATFLGGYTVPGTAVAGDLFTLDNAALLNFLQADTNGLVTLMVRRNGGQSANNLSFASKENTDLPGPRLNLTLPAVPEPATMSLLGLAGVALLRRRRLA